MSKPVAQRIGPGTRAELLRLARRSVELGLQRGLELGAAAPLESHTLPAPLRERGAAFVTLLVNGALRGCCGSLERENALGLDVWNNAYASAFLDPRLPAIEMAELRLMTVEISVLSTLEAIDPVDTSDLIARLRPGVDGVLVESGTCRATFLPKVWESLPDPAEFLGRLREKAGLPADRATRSLHWHRYTTETFAGGPVH